MNSEQIGQAAGQIWEMLSQASGQINITDVAKRTNLTSQLAYQGLGWLAREGKIEYTKKGRSVYVALCGAECTC